jgi:hypothetical protein
MPERDAAEKAVLIKITLLLGGPTLIIGAAALLFVARRFDVPLPLLLILFLLLFPATWGLIRLVETGTARSAHGLVEVLHAAHVAHPRVGFSRQQSLVAQGKLHEAAAAYREHLQAHPDDHEGQVALGRLLAGALGDTEGAVAAYRAARELAPGGDWDRIISNDLIDLYERTKQEGRLRVELARFGERFRGTKAGEAAIERLRALKRGLG